MASVLASAAAPHLQQPRCSESQMADTFSADVLLHLSTSSAAAVDLAALDMTLTAERIATLDAVSKPPLSFPAGYAQISQMFGFPGTRIDSVQMSPSPMLAASTARY